MRKYLDTKQLEASLAVVIIDFHKQGIISARTLKRCLENLRGIQTAKIKTALVKAQIDNFISATDALKD